MLTCPFAVSLNSKVQVSTTEDGYIFSSATARDQHQVATSIILPTVTGTEEALAQLQEGSATPNSLMQTLANRGGQAASELFASCLQQLDARGWLNYSVLPLAIATPMIETARLNLEVPQWSQALVSLSRFAYQRVHANSMVLESPLSKYRVRLLDWHASVALAQLVKPQSRQKVTPPKVRPETIYQFLNLLWATSFLAIEAEAPEFKLWEFHNLLFHSRCRQGRHDYLMGDIESSLDVWDKFPVVKPSMSSQIVALPQQNIDVILQRDQALTMVIEKRQSIRKYDDNHPITISQLGELLHRTARVKGIYTLDGKQQELLKAQFGQGFDWGELSHRPYPTGGGIYELEIYPVVRRCVGIKPGLYHYDPLNHQLTQIDAAEANIQALLTDAYHSSGKQGVPQVLLVITARFGRLFRKYRSLAYALVLKHVGVLYQNLYLVATDMELAPCALGSGDSDCFARATGLAYVVESSVGEFMIGSLPYQEINTISEK